MYSPNSYQFVRFEVFTVVTMKNVFWEVGLCRSCVNRSFGGTYRLNFQGRKMRQRGTSVSRWLQNVANYSTLKWRQYVLPKRRLTQDLQSATSQKKTFFNYEFIHELDHHLVHQTRHSLTIPSRFILYRSGYRIYTCLCT
jgi:hypothetical protein